MKRTFFFWMFALEGLVGLHRTIQLQFFGISGLGIDLDYFDTEWFALETNKRSFCHFEIPSKYCISMEKAMATHSSTLALKIPWMEEPGRLQSMGLRRVGHN